MHILESIIAPVAVKLISVFIGLDDPAFNAYMCILMQSIIS